MKLLLTALASSALAVAAAANADTNGATKFGGSNRVPKYRKTRGDLPNSHRVMMGGMSKPKPLDKNAKSVWEQAKKSKTAKVPSGYLGTIGDPVFVQTQVVSGINYRYTFKNGMQVTVNSTPWRQQQPVTILDVSYSPKKVTTAAKASNVAGMHLTQTQRNRALKEFKKQDINGDGSIPNGAAYTALTNLEAKEDQSSRKCKGWEEVTQHIVGSNPTKKLRIDDFMRAYTDFEVARRSMRYFSKYAGKDCVLTGYELQQGIRKTFGTNISKEDVMKIIKKYSQDKDPAVSFQEFYAMYKDYEASQSDAPNKGKGKAPANGTLNDKEASVAEKGWNALDTSKDGFVQNKEFSSKFQTVLQRMRNEGKGSKQLLDQLKAYFKYFAGKDGKLSHVEYLKMMEVMKSKVGAATFDKFLNTLTSSNCGQLKDCYKCVSADLSCAWMPKPTKNPGGASFAIITPRKTDGKCIEAKTATFLDSAMLRGAPMNSSPSYTSRSQCGNAYDRPHVYDGMMPPPVQMDD